MMVVQLRMRGFESQDLLIDVDMSKVHQVWKLHNTTINTITMIMRRGVDVHRRSTVAVLLLLVVVLLPVVQCKSLYDVLGVSESATTKQIRTAYKRLARKWSVVACDTSF